MGSQPDHVERRGRINTRGSRQVPSHVAYGNVAPALEAETSAGELTDSVLVPLGTVGTAPRLDLRAQPRVENIALTLASHTHTPSLPQVE